jgi:hypothetical protein
MRAPVLLLLGMLLLAGSAAAAEEGAEEVNTPYEAQKVVYDFYFDEPAKIATALYWLRAHIKPLSEEPYNIPPDFLDIKVVIHGTEIVTVVRKNQERFPDVVQRMRYYDRLGVDFKVCSLAAQDYDYRTEDFYAFIDVVPSAMAELAHWQQKGYALMVPTVYERKHAIEDIR